MEISQRGKMNSKFLDTCYHIQLKDIINLRAIFKCLAADPSIRESPTNAHIEIICPRPWSKAFFQAFLQQLYPKNPSTDISIRKTRLIISFPVDLNGRRKRIHLNDNAIMGLCLAMYRVSSSSCCNGNFAEGGR